MSARSAISCVVVAAKPFEANSARAAALMRSRFSSLLRSLRPRGVSAADALLGRAAYAGRSP